MTALISLPSLRSNHICASPLTVCSTCLTIRFSSVVGRSKISALNERLQRIF
jgi:hypothetical protein